MYPPRGKDKLLLLCNGRLLISILSISLSGTHGIKRQKVLGAMLGYICQFRQWGTDIHSRDMSCSDCGYLVEAGPGCPLIQAFLHQLNSSCSNMGPGHGQGTGKCCWAASI